VALAPDVFARYLAERLPAGVPPAVAVRPVHTVDLYLACACARGDLAAFAAFENRCLRDLDRILLGMGIGEDGCADVKQEIRARLLAGTHGGPQIAEFSGRGDLRSWVRVIAVRMVLQHHRRTRREMLFDDDDLLWRAVGASAGEPDRRRKAAYQQAFRAAFDAALQTLPAQARTVLRQHYIDNLTIDELGALYRVHRSTAARLLVRARAQLLENTRAGMGSRLGVDPADLDSIMRTIRSQVEVSLRALLCRPQHHVARRAVRVGRS
jgi:RNA polymerase sigma-70 factor (ECF subfamily)